MTSDQLSLTFAALADPTRRAILASLASGETSVTELTVSFEMSLPAITKHLKVLERAGLITRGKEAQWHPCKLAAQPLQDASNWIRQYREFWEESFDWHYLQELQKNDTAANKTASKTAKKGRRKISAKNETASQILELPSDHELVITRVLDAPRELVWQAWTRPEALAK